MTELAALLTKTAIAPIDPMGWLRITGSDRVRWLNGMVTNSIQGLAPGEGNYSFLLNAQGRIEGDLTAFLLDGAILLETGQPGRVAAHLDHFIIMDDVELTDISANRRGILAAGPAAAELLSGLELRAPEAVRIAGANWRGQPVDLVGAHSPLVPRFELWGSAEVIDALTQAMLGAGAAQVGAEALEQLRVLEGTPLYGTDTRNTEAAKDLPQETNQLRALHFNKGCYLGQEIVERIRSRGQVHKTFSGFLLAGAPAASGTALTSEDGERAVGELTSVVSMEHPVQGPVQLALGYVRREALERKLPLRYPGGTATPVELPYRPA